MSQPRVLDGCCGGGGASVGWCRAGFDVTGVDLHPQPDYPFRMIEADILTVLTDVDFLDTFDAVHISPPCQASCTLTKGTNKGREYPQLIPAVRDLLTAWGGPFAIENVQGSALRRDLVLCGEMFGLGVIRHRYFEVHGFDVAQPAHVKHRGRVAGWRHGQYFDGPYFAVYGDGGGKGTVEQWQQAMGIDWTADRKTLAEAIPPAYSEFIGAQLLQQVEAVAA